MTNGMTFFMIKNDNYLFPFSPYSHFLHSFFKPLRVKPQCFHTRNLILELKIDTSQLTTYKYIEAIEFEPLKLNLLIDTTLFDLIVPIVQRKDSTLILD